MNWEKLNHRERRMVIIGGSLALILLYLFAFLIPTLENGKKLKKRILTRESEFKEMESLVKELRSLPAAVATKSSDPMISRLENIATRAGVKNKMSYLRPFKPAKGEGAEIKLQELNGSELVRLLHFMQRENMPIIQINMMDYEGDGLWVIKILVGG